jgi:hypothetical protein
MPLIAGIGAPIAGGIIGNIAAQGSQSQDQQALQNALAQIQGVNVPGVAEQQWQLAQEQAQGALTPEALAAYQMGPNAMSGIQTNPAYAQAQQQQLQALQQLGAGGLTAQERANIISANQQAAGVGNAANAATLQAMNARGMGGSGAQLAAQLANNQNAANMASQQGANINAQAQNQALGAMSQAGSLAGQMQAQQFGQQAAIAQAQNAINQFNTQNQQQVAGYNTQAQNQAQAANLANQQAIANQNVNTQNQQIAHNTGLYQQQFQDQMAQAQAAAGAEGNLAGMYGNQAANTAGMWSGIGSGVGSAANAYGTQQALGNLTNAYNNTNIPAPSSNSSSSGSPSLNYGQQSTSNGGNIFGVQTSFPGFNSNQSAGGQYKGGMIEDNYAHGGEVGYSGSKQDSRPGGSGASWQPTYAEGGDVEKPHDAKNLDQLLASFKKFLSEEKGYSVGGSVRGTGTGEVSTLGMYSYNKGGDVGMSGGGGGGAGAGAGASGAGAMGGMGGHGGVSGKGGGIPPKRKGYDDGGQVESAQDKAAGLTPQQRQQLMDDITRVASGGRTPSGVPTGTPSTVPMVKQMNMTAPYGTQMVPASPNPSQYNPLIFSGPGYADGGLIEGQVNRGEDESEPRAQWEEAEEPKKPEPKKSDSPKKEGYAKGGKVNEAAVAKAMHHADTPHAGAKARAHLNPASDAAAIMKEHARGTLYSGSGHKVTDPAQAKAIAMSESGQSRYADGGQIAPNPYSPGVRPEYNDGRHSATMGGGSPMRDSRDQNSATYSGNMYSPMSSQMRSGVDARAAQMRPGQPGVPLNMMSNGGEAQWDFRSGGHVPGKAQVAGDSPKNDTVHAKLSPGEIVVKRTVAQSGDPEKIMNFIKDVLNKRK